MTPKEKAAFVVDESKCIHCGRCVAVCTGMVLHLGDGGIPRMDEFERFGWRGCWGCEHCLAVCPAGAISIFGKVPEGSLPPAPPEADEHLERVIANRRSCRRYRDENVDPAIIDRILRAMQCAPAGGNANNTEFTVVDDKDRMRQIRAVAYAKMEEAAARRPCARATCSSVARRTCSWRTRRRQASGQPTSPSTATWRPPTSSF